MKDLNLIPKSYILENKNRARRLRITAAGTFAFAFLVIATIIPLLYSYSLTQQKRLLEAEVQTGSGYARTLGQLTHINNLLKSRETESTRLEAKAFTVSDIMSSIEKSLPSKISILNLNFNSGVAAGSEQITLNGVSNTEDEIASFINHLRKNGMFREVALSSVRRSGAGIAQNAEGSGDGRIYYSFTITIYLNGRDVVR